MAFQVLPPSSILFFWILLGWHRVACQRFYNVTVDDSDSAVHYAGNWIRSSFTELDEGGSHMLAQDPNALAVFDFHGVSVFFLSPLWPYDVTTQVQLDSRPPEILNLRDFDAPKTDGGLETVGSHVVWGAEDLDDQPHQLKITVAPGNQWGVVDGIIFTAINQSAIFTRTALEVTTTTRASSVSATSTGFSTLSSTVGNPDFLAIGLGTGSGVVAVVAASLALYFFCRRRNHRPRLHLDLEKDLPRTPEPTPAFSNSSCLSTPSASSPAIPWLPPSIKPPSKGHHGASLPAPRRLPSPPVQHIEIALRRITLDRPPPSYYDCVNSHHLSIQMPQLPASTVHDSGFSSTPSRNSPHGYSKTHDIQE